MARILGLAGNDVEDSLIRQIDELLALKEETS